MKLLIATGNKNKLREIREIFNISSLEILDSSSFSRLPVVEEDGDTYSSNASKKARTFALATGLWALADDSGLDVDVLGGAPGVISARYAGTHGDDKANMDKLLKELSKYNNRNAKFVSVISLSDPYGNTDCVEGVIHGKIISEPRGSNGFGYDPIFIPDGSNKTFAEMDSEEKNSISHRHNALIEALNKWGDILKGNGMTSFQKITTLNNFVEGEIISAELKRAHIPFEIIRYTDSVFDGIMQQQKGWGTIRSPAFYKESIINVVNMVRRNNLD